jgi:hypothetical protein
LGEDGSYAATIGIHPRFTTCVYTHASNYSSQQFHELDAYVWACVMNLVWVPMVAPWGLPLPNFFMIHMTTQSLRATKIRQMREQPTVHRL